MYIVLLGNARSLPEHGITGRPSRVPMTTRPTPHPLPPPPTPTSPSNTFLTWWWAVVMVTMVTTFIRYFWRSPLLPHLGCVCVGGGGGDVVGRSEMVLVVPGWHARNNKALRFSLYTLVYHFIFASIYQLLNTDHEYV